MTLHVVQLGPVPPPEGGISRNIQAIRQELSARGQRCSLVATSRSSTRVEEPDVYWPSGPVTLVRQVRRLKPDVLHLHVGGDLNRRVMALAVASTLLSERTVLTVHSGAFPLTEEARSASPHSGWGRVFGRFTHLIAVNDALAEVFQHYGIPDDRISRISPHALSAPDENIEIPFEFRAFMARHSPVLLAVGGLERDYDPLFQITALKNVLDSMPNTGLMIVGDGSMRFEVGSALANSGYADRVLLAGNVEHAVTLHLIRNADIMLRTTLFDGDAISVREALYLGTPVIATDSSERPEGVEVIPQGDVTALSDKVSQILGRQRSRNGHHPPDNSNICAIVSLYERIVYSDPAI